MHDVELIQQKYEALKPFLDERVRQHGGSTEAMHFAGELKLRAERKLGELLGETVQRGGSGSNQYQQRLHDETFASLPDGIGKMQSHRRQTEATLPEDDFEQYLAEELQARGHPIGRRRVTGSVRCMKSRYYHISEPILLLVFTSAPVGWWVGLEEHGELVPYPPIAYIIAAILATCTASNPLIKK